MLTFAMIKREMVMEIGICDGQITRTFHFGDVCDMEVCYIFVSND